MRGRNKAVLAALVAVVALVALLIYARGVNEIPSTAQQPGQDQPAAPQPHAPNNPAQGR